MIFVQRLGPILGHFRLRIHTFSYGVTVVFTFCCPPLVVSPSVSSRLGDSLAYCLDAG